MRRTAAGILVFALLSSCGTLESAARGRPGGGRLGGIRSASRGGFSGRGISQVRTPSRFPAQSHFNRGSLNRSPSFTVPKTSHSRIRSGVSNISGAGSNGSGLKRSSVTIPPGIGSRHTQRDARPQIGSGNLTDSASRIKNSGLNTRRVQTGQFPGLEHRPAVTLPGLKTGNAAQQLHNRFPDLNHDTLRQQISAAGDSRAVTRDKFEAWREQQKIDRGRVPQRRQNLQDRLSGIDRESWQQRRDENREDRQEFREQRREDWQQHRDGAREDWQNWYDDRYYYHYGWYRGGWHYSWDRYWDHLWYEYPAAVAFGLTYWGVNTMAYSFGTMTYVNPYYTGQPTGGPSDYSQPQVAVEPTDADDAATEPPEVPQQGLQLFEQARTAFHTGQYAEAQQLADNALKVMPHDVLVHEFRALTFFAQQQYTQAATVLHSVLAVSPGWDWTTMSQLYPGLDVYTTHLRALENWTGQHPNLPEGHFVLAYHYLTCGHRDDAATQLKLVVQALPDDSVAARLLNQLTGEPPKSSGPSEPPPAREPETPAIPVGQLTGQWAASANAAAYRLELRQDGRFVWTYSQSGKSQSVAGVYAIDGSTLALEPDSGGVMLADLHLKDSQLSFRQVGADSALVFTRR